MNKKIIMALIGGLALATAQVAVAGDKKADGKKAATGSTGSTGTTGATGATGATGHTGHTAPTK